METRKTRGKRLKYNIKPESDSGESDSNDFDDLNDIRKSKIRDCNKEFAKRMTILQAWSEYWSDYTTREGDAYPKKEAKSIIKRTKKITCPIQACKKAFTTYGGLRYHYARCNIERCFKCKRCDPISDHKTRGDLLRHMVRAHYDQLPELDREQKEIAQSYLSGSGKIDRAKNKKLQNDCEASMGCWSAIKLYHDLVDRTFKPNDCGQLPFKEWQTLSQDWELLAHEIDRRRYYPPEKESPHIRNSTSNKWDTVNAGSSTILRHDDRSSSQLFFTGGVSTSAAWLPKPPREPSSNESPEIIAISVNCCPMDKTFIYKDCRDVTGCIQFWTTRLANKTARSSDIDTRCSISFMIGHNYGYVFDMTWCPLGASWQPRVQTYNSQIVGQAHSLARVGLLALACGDGLVRIISVPHTESFATLIPVKHSESPLETAPIYRVKAITTLTPPGVGPSTDYQNLACTSLNWNLENNQRLIAAGYSNGMVALFDLANYSPILYSNDEHRHIYRPLKSWFAHSLPVSAVAISSKNFDRSLIVTGSRDKQMKMWNTMDLNSCLTTEKSPITKLIWDYRLRGVVSACESAFSSFQNRVTYKLPTTEGFNAITVSLHRATVWGLTNSIVTGSLATSDDAGEVFVSPLGRPPQKKDKNHLNTHSLYTLLPRAIDSDVMNSNHIEPKHKVEALAIQSHVSLEHNGLTQQDISNDKSVLDSSVVVHGLEDSRQLARLDPVRPESIRVITMQDENNVQLNEEDLDELSNGDNNQADYTFVERSVANKPAEFLLPIEHRAVETYADFKQNFGLEFVNYDTSIPPRREQKMPKSCSRAADTNSIYCDRVCDYPFCSIKNVTWSPNVECFSHLLSVTHIGLCRLERVEIIDQVYKGCIETTNESKREMENFK